MEYVLGYIFFFLASYFSFYIPGKLALSRIFDFLSEEELVLLSWPIGISLFLFGIYIFSWIHLQYIYLFILIGTFMFALLKEHSLFKFSIKLDILSFIIILLGSLTFLSLMAFSYFPMKNGIQFVGTTNVMDGLLHIAYTKNLLSTFPPNHAGLANIPLRGYHYFYDLLMSKFVLFYHFRVEDVYYRYLPILISVVYGAGFYIVTNLLTNNKISLRLVLFFAYFAQSSAFALSFLIKSIGPTAELGSIYPLELILNPSIILSIGMLLSALFLLLKMKNGTMQFIALGFLFGIITEMKVYVGIIGIITLFLVLLYRTIKTSKYFLSYALGFLSALAVIVITYVPNNLGAGNLWFSPFFPYSVYMQEPPFTSWNWEIQRIIFRDHHNIPHLFILYAEAFGLFWLLSLGSRVIFLLGLSKAFKASFWKQEKNLAIIFLISIPIIIGSFFVQSISIFDTKQFFWIAGALIAIPSGLVLGNLVIKLNRLLRLLFISAVIFLSWGGIVGQLNNFVFHSEYQMVSWDDVNFLSILGSYIPKNSYIVYLPKLQPETGLPLAENSSLLTTFPFSSAPVVAAFSGKPTYFEPESAQFDLPSIYKKRKQNLSLLRQYIDSCKSENIKGLIKNIGSPFVITTSREQCLIQVSRVVKSNSSGLTFYIINT